MNINVVILAAGSSNFKTERDYPICLIEIDRISLLEKIIKQTQDFTNPFYSFVFLKNDNERFHFNEIVSLLTDNFNNIYVETQTKGSACSTLIATCNLNQDIPLLILSANEYADVNLSDIINTFSSKNLDAGAIVFESIHPRYSFVKLDENNFVVESSQRIPISKNATTGTFWFNKTSTFCKYAKQMIKKNINTDSLFYLAPVFNEMILDNLLIGISTIDKNKYYPFKSDNQINSYNKISEK